MPPSHGHPVPSSWEIIRLADRLQLLGLEVLVGAGNGSTIVIAGSPDQVAKAVARAQALKLARFLSSEHDREEQRTTAKVELVQGHGGPARTGLGRRRPAAG